MHCFVLQELAEGELGQSFEMQFYAPHAAGKPTNELPLCVPTPSITALCLATCAGKYDLQLLCMPDSWVGCDRAVPIKLRVEPRTRADREGRGRRAGLQRSEESEALMQGAAAGGCLLV